MILLVDPLKAFYFVIAVIVIQQLDGNVIGPKILGNTIGISGFWVLASITIAAGIFGFAGMLLGVPVFALLYVIISDAVNARLRKKQHTTVTEDYRDIPTVEDLVMPPHAPRVEPQPVGAAQTAHADGSAQPDEKRQEP